jgi:hypothetical protein
MAMTQPPGTPEQLLEQCKAWGPNIDWRPEGVSRPRVFGYSGTWILKISAYPDFFVATIRCSEGEHLMWWARSVSPIYALEEAIRVAKHEIQLLQGKKLPELS